FLWPRARRADGKAFGFDMNILSRIKAEYEDKAQFYAQYYNNPNDPSTARISRDKFQYYDRKFVKATENGWEINGKKLNIFAGLDFAFSRSKRADSTCLVVVGVDSDHNYYVLDIE